MITSCGIRKQAATAKRNYTEHACAETFPMRDFAPGSLGSRRHFGDRLLPIVSRRRCSSVCRAANYHGKSNIASRFRATRSCLSLSLSLSFSLSLFLSRMRVFLRVNSAVVGTSLKSASLFFRVARSAWRFNVVRVSRYVSAMH
jgi:hypothetical protein